MVLDKADDEENRRRTLCRTSRIFRGVQRSIKTFIALVLVIERNREFPGIPPWFVGRCFTFNENIAEFSKYAMEKVAPTVPILLFYSPILLRN